MLRELEREKQKPDERGQALIPENLEKDQAPVVETIHKGQAPSAEITGKEDSRP